MIIRFAGLTVLSLVSLFAAVSAAQQTVPFRGTTPIAPNGIPAVPLSDKPMTFDTAEGQKIRVTVIARGIAHPWSLAFLPDGGMLVTERGGKLRIIRNGVLDPQPIAGVPAVQAAGLSGLMDVAAPCEVCREPLRLPDLHEATRRKPDDAGTRSGDVQRERADRGARHLRRAAPAAPRALRSHRTARSS